MAEDKPIPDFSAYGKLPKNFLNLVRERREIGEMMRTLEGRAHEIGEALCAGMIAAKAKQVMVEGAPVTFVTQRRGKIDGRKLLELGVASDVVVKATVYTESSYVTVGKAVDSEYA